MAQRPTENDPLFQEIRRRLIEGLRPVPTRIVVFGSHARGEAGTDSDLDLMVVVDTQGSPGERSRLVRRPLRGLHLPMDVIVYTPSEYERYRQWRSSVATIADREGVVLHG